MQWLLDFARVGPRWLFVVTKTFVKRVSASLMDKAKHSLDALILHSRPIGANSELESLSGLELILA